MIFLKNHIFYKTIILFWILKILKNFKIFGFQLHNPCLLGAKIYLSNRQKFTLFHKNAKFSGISANFRCCFLQKMKKSHFRILFSCNSISVGWCVKFQFWQGTAYTVKFPKLWLINNIFVSLTIKRLPYLIWHIILRHSSSVKQIRLQHLVICMHLNLERIFISIFRLNFGNIRIINPNQL